MEMLPPCVPEKLGKEYERIIRDFGPAKIKFTSEQAKELAKDAETFDNVKDANV